MTTSLPLHPDSTGDSIAQDPSINLLTNMEFLNACFFPFLALTSVSGKKKKVLKQAKAHAQCY